VLDVDDVAEYSAFLLPNTYRLIIDIHGKLPPNQVASNKNSKAVAQETKSVAPDANQPAPDAVPAQDVTVSTIKQPESKPAVPKASGDAATAI